VSAPRRVVITGAGTVATGAVGGGALAQLFERGAAAATEVPGEPALDRAGASRRALLVDPAATAEWLDPLDGRRMCPPSRLAVAAARIALADAGLSREALRGERSAICLGTAWGSLSNSLKLLEQLQSRGPLGMSPFLFMESVANAPAGQVALDLGLRGPNGTVTQREASALAAVVRGSAWIAQGRADRVLVGAVDEASPLLLAVLDRFGALAAAGRARPFDRGRDGLLAAEGAALWLLEEESSAMARGARLQARVSCAARAHDPTATGTDWGQGSAELAAACSRALARAGVELHDLGRVISGANGSVRGDRLEALTLRALFGRELPPVLAPKGQVGEYGGGFLAALLPAMVGESFPAGLATAEPDPELGVSAFGGGRLPPASRVLCTSLAAGGAAAWVVLERR
jgi:3-oxoacyl-[acyl-carrier-protein] synthase II